jgi:HSP20 family protein
MSEKKRKKKDEKVPIKEKKGEMVTWRPSDVFDEMDRIFEDFKTNFQDLFIPERRWAWPIRMPRSILPDVRSPFCDLVDSGNEYKYCAEMPGIPKDKIDIKIDESSIEISAEAQTESKEEKEYISRERSYSSFYRSTKFPEKVVPEKAEASFENGILEVTVPKKAPTKINKRKIKIK